MEKPLQIKDVSFATDKAFRLTPCTDYVCTIADNGSSGAAKLQLWNGKAWLDCPASDGSTSQVFTFTSPPSGRVHFNISAGTVLVSCAPKAPTYIRNS